MERNYRLKQEKLLNEHILDQEILIHCIARLNTKIDRAYRKCKIIKASYENNIKYGCSSLALYDKQDYEKWEKEYDHLIRLRKPLFDTLMKGYHLDLDTVKGMLSQADKEKIPTYGTVDRVIGMIEDHNFRLR